MTLSEIEIRIIGSLIEKEKTTPEYYPLTANSLLNACNQSSNRAPVMSLALKELNEGIDSLLEKKLIEKVSNIGKTMRYGETFTNIYEFSEQQTAIIGVLFLRGKQTVGELNTRTGRLTVFESLPEIESALGDMMKHPHGPYVEMLQHQPGQKGVRYNHCFYGDPGEMIIEEKKKGTVLLKTSTDNQRFLELEEEVSRLKYIIDDLQERIVALETKSEY